MSQFKLFIALAAGIALSFPATAKLYKWVDENGTTHYSETIPPKYADKDRAELNKTGRVIKQQEVLTPEERRAKKEADALKREEEEAAREQRRYDNALVSTYSNVDEIELARTRNLQQVEARINSINSQVKSANDNLLSFQKEVDRYNAAGKKIPVSLRDDLQESQSRLDTLQQDLKNAKAEKAALDARYDADKARYKELTGR